MRWTAGVWGLSLPDTHAVFYCLGPSGSNVHSAVQPSSRENAMDLTLLKLSAQESRIKECSLA